MPKPVSSTSPVSQSDRVRSVLRALMRPLAKLALARGVKYQELADILKLAVMDAGRDTLREAQQRVNASTLSVSTGLHRKDLATFLNQDEPRIDAEPAIEARVFAAWTTDRRFLDARGLPRALPRLSDHRTDGKTLASFEDLARSVTTDVRPRAVFESMLRLGLLRVRKDEQLELTGHELIPSRAQGKMLELLRDNVSDHMSAAVANSAGHDPAFLEQSIYASGLTDQSAERIHANLRSRWLSLTQAMVPRIQQSIDTDKAAIDDNAKKPVRVRIGMYFYSEAQHKDESQ
jgi:Family of unknown function (DUF6502)